MSDKDNYLQAYLELADKATPGPWEVSKDAVHYVDVVNKQLSVANCLDYPITNSDRRANAAFIALSRTVGPAAARRALAAEAELRELREENGALYSAGKSWADLALKANADLTASQGREAALREAIKEIPYSLLKDLTRQGCSCGQRYDCTCGYMIRFNQWKKAEAALALTPAASDRVAKLERVAEAARWLHEELNDCCNDWALLDEVLAEALAELDGEAKAKHEAATNEAMHTGDYTALAELDGDSPK